MLDQVRSVLFRPKDLLLDAAIGGAAAGIFYGIGKPNTSKPILNNKGMPYPNVEVPEYGKVPFPKKR